MSHHYTPITCSHYLLVHTFTYRQHPPSHLGFHCRASENAAGEMPFHRTHSALQVRYVRLLGLVRFGLVGWYECDVN